MKLINCLAGAGIIAMLGATAPFAWCQATDPNVSNAAASIAPAATSPTVPAEKAAPGAPGSSVDSASAAAAGTAVTANNPAEQTAAGVSNKDMINSEYVHNKIAQAQSQGKDVSAARMQEAMGDAAMKKGMSDEAAQHFETALRSIGEMPNAPGENPGEADSPHNAMPGAVD
jgi:hypothetical protein